MYRLLSVVSVSMICGGAALACATLASSDPLARPQYGIRGLKRRQALDRGGVFATFEPLLLLIGSWFGAMPIDSIRERVDRRILHAGEPGGLRADEFFALSLLTAIGSTFFFVVAGNIAQLPTFTVVLGAIFGLLGPWLQIGAAANQRLLSIERALPTTIDLAALCMGAGLDFPGTLRQIVDKAADRDEPIIDELGRILHTLGLGHTRSYALEQFAERVPTEAVQEFVSRVVQSESRGTPLARVLVIQSQTLRRRRAVAAEENAAKAGILMMGPLMMLFLCILLLLMGPFVLQMANGGLM